MLGWFLLFLGAGWLVYKYRRTDINPNEEESSSTLSPSAVFLIIVAILVVLVIIMAAILYAWVQPLPGYYKSSPDGTLMAFEGDDGVWDIQIIKMNPQTSIASVNWYLMDVQGLTKDEGGVRDIYGFKQGEGQSITFIDSDYNAKLSPGDIFRFYPGEGATLADEPSLNDYSFRIKFNPTADTIGYDVEFTS